MNKEPLFLEFPVGLWVKVVTFLPSVIYIGKLQ
jgi:hypothetical protein